MRQRFDELCDYLRAVGLGKFVDSVMTMGDSAEQRMLLAVRADPRVGHGTLSTVDEAMTDAEVLAHLKEFGIRTPAGAVREMRAVEELRREQEGNTRYE